MPVLNKFHFGYLNKERQRFYISTVDYHEKIKTAKDKNNHKEI